jgi:hypothetical protein
MINLFMSYLTMLSVAGLCRIDWMGYRRMMVWEVFCLLQVLSQHLHGDTEENLEKTQSWIADIQAEIRT